jgi:hypothetical protein
VPVAIITLIGFAWVDASHVMQPAQSRGSRSEMSLAGARSASSINSVLLLLYLALWRRRKR